MIDNERTASLNYEAECRRLQEENELLGNKCDYLYDGLNRCLKDLEHLKGFKEAVELIFGKEVNR